MTPILSALDLRALLLQALSRGALVLALRVMAFFTRFSGPPPRHRAKSSLRTRWQRWQTLIAARPPNAPSSGPGRRAEPLHAPYRRPHSGCRVRAYEEPTAYAWPTHDYDLDPPFVSPESEPGAVVPVTAWRDAGQEAGWEADEREPVAAWPDADREPSEPEAGAPVAEWRYEGWVSVDPEPVPPVVTPVVAPVVTTAVLPPVRESVWVDPDDVHYGAHAADPWQSPPSPAGAHAGAAR